MPFCVKAPVQHSAGTAYNRMVEQLFQKMEQGVLENGTTYRTQCRAF